VIAQDDPRPVVVGVDGSDASVDAALWATDEAVDRNAPLRLVSVTGIARPHTPEQTPCPELEYAESALRMASAAVIAAGKQVKLETEVLWGQAASALIDESRDAALVSVSSVGIGAIARASLGSTAAAVAERSHCPVAVIRPFTATQGSWVAVAVDTSVGDDAIIEYALHEARLRHSALIAVGVGCNVFGVNTPEETASRTREWAQRCPDIQIETVPTWSSLADYLAKDHDDLSRRHGRSDVTTSGPMAVIGSAEVSQLSQLVGPHGDDLLQHARCSVLVVR
jgi:nucleotide-binding universal stress UspA family protein